LAATALLHVAAALQQMLPQFHHSIVVAACCHAASYGIVAGLCSRCYWQQVTA